ncbi:MAG: hypothetical protein AAF585_15335, partial [Verrucomicrobiota bacterium]
MNSSGLFEIGGVRIAFRSLLAKLIIMLVWGGNSAIAETTTLESLQTQFTSREAQLKKPLTELGESYERALTQLRDELQKKGDLKGVVALKAELERLEDDGSPNETVSGFEPLARIQKIYGNNYGRIFAEIGTDLKKNHTIFERELGTLITKLTQDGKIDEALKAQKVLDEVKDLIDSGKPLSATDSQEKALVKDLVLYISFDTET